MNNIMYLDAYSHKKPISVYLITNEVDDAYVYTNFTKVKQKMKEVPNYTIYVWPLLKYSEGWYGKAEVNWKRAYKNINDTLVFDDTEIPWNMLQVAKDKSQWHTRAPLTSISFAKSQFANRTYYSICGYDVPKEKDTNDECIWMRGFAEARIDDREWLINYKNTLHPNDDWTNVNIETYARWLHAIDNSERHKVIDAALEAGIVGFLD